MRTNVLEVENLIRNYRKSVIKESEEDVKVLKGISFQVAEGEFVGIMGKSGCGKTTLLKTLGMIDKPTDGTIKFMGEDTSELYGDKLADIRNSKIGFIFQDFYLMDSLSVEENIMLPMIISKQNINKMIAEAKKYADAQEVARRAQEIKEETARIRKQALKEAARRKEEKRVANRQAVADFAVQFVGNPYVWGGTSLTNGADCSGFVMSVFANFGYELPRVAAAQYSASQKRDLSQMEVGDLVFYGSGISHVALYIGDGKVVHALNSNKGIVITDYNYDTPVGVGSYME